MNYGCEGKVAFISGGTSGIGKAVAELLLKDGAEVWLLGRDAEKGTEAAVTLSAYGKVHYVDHLPGFRYLNPDVSCWCRQQPLRLLPAPHPSRG